MRPIILKQDSSSSFCIYDCLTVPISFWWKKQHSLLSSFLMKFKIWYLLGRAILRGFLGCFSHVTRVKTYLSIFDTGILWWYLYIARSGTTLMQ